jgi:penicillin-binding protein 2
MTSREIRISAYLVIGVMAILCLRLWQLQILDGAYYKKLSEDNRLRIVRTAAPRGIIYDRNNTALVENIPTFAVYLSPDAIKTIDIESIASLLQMKREEIEEKVYRKDSSPFVPIKLKHGLTFRDVARIEGSRSYFPGLFIDIEAGRQYPFRKVGAHVIGYLGKITTAQLADPEMRRLPPDILIGQWGLEALLDKQLRGSPGERVIEVDALGRELRLLQQRRAVKGQDITVSIDIGIQGAVHAAFGKKAGAVAAVDPGSGEILALESFPSFDPNTFAQGLMHEEWNKLVSDGKKPMLNRTLQSQYPPGSIFKIVTAIAALEEGVITPETNIYCKGIINYGKWSFGCWRKGGHGLVDFHKAVVESCDVFFYELGKRVGIERIYRYATAMGLGKPTGMDLAKEKTGLIPNAQWKKENRGLPWYLGDTFISAIGQGFVSVTPLQAAVMTATFANGGYIYIPTLRKGETFHAKPIQLKSDTVLLLKQALRGAVNESNGTGKGARSSIVTIAGKTGTAQVASKKRGSGDERFADHAWFVAFAPVEKPGIAVAVLVEHGGGGGAVAAPIAKKAIEAYFMNQDNKAMTDKP